MKSRLLYTLGIAIFLALAMWCKPHERGYVITKAKMYGDSCRYTYSPYIGDSIQYQRVFHFYGRKGAFKVYDKISIQ